MTAAQTPKSEKMILNGELISWLLIIAILNSPLLTGNVSDQFVYFTDRVTSGEWWRILTFPFVHVSLYHLLLDALAFLWLWHDLYDLPARKRWGCLAACWGGSLILPLLISEQIDAHGLAGLSGIGHGLFVFYCLNCARRAKKSKDQLLYYVSLVLVLGLVVKSVLETFAGQLFFTGMHFGEIGVPIVETHLGGLVGGVLAYVCFFCRGSRQVMTVPESGSGRGCNVAGIDSSGYGDLNVVTACVSRSSGGKHV